LEKGQILDQKRIPFECCLTSNIKCCTVSTFDDHHFFQLFRNNYPVVVCVSCCNSILAEIEMLYCSSSYSQTDDFGVFNTTLSNELKICVKTFDLTQADIVKLCENAIEHSFTDVDEKQQLREKLHSFVATGNVQK
jgi:adenosine deaminase